MTEPDEFAVYDLQTELEGLRFRASELARHNDRLHEALIWTYSQAPARARERMVRRLEQEGIDLREASDDAERRWSGDFQDGDDRTKSRYSRATGRNY